ncbi:MAG: class I SAM-dependent methyltransferase [Acidobacteria bacterium]|nr:class I SAM-dependent methyltransferase [Acidobacteriota bacterium]
MNCSICNSGDVRRIGTKNSFDIVRCRTCRTLFAKKIEAAADDFDYSTYYDEANLSVPDFVKESYLRTISDLESHRGNNRFLDVGCGAGTLLRIANELNWDTTGVEVSKPAAEHLRSEGLNVFKGTLDEANFSDNSFDVITCTEVIEHVTDPKGLLKEIARILSPDGILWMTTPHSNGLSGKLLGANWSVVAPPEHLNLFSAKSMKLCLDEVGLKNCRFASNGFNPMEVIRALRSGDSQTSDVQNDEISEEHSKTDSNNDNFDRVESSYALNKWFVGGKYKQKIKGLINSMLSITGNGDTLKVWARFK